MTLAGIELRYLVNEINSKTTDYYVSNIYSITKNSILFKLHHPEKADILLMFSTFGLWTSTVRIDQIEINRLVRRFRNDIMRLKLTNIKQIGTERIAYLTFSGFDKEFVLVGEFFGGGNIILCNKEMKILALLHSIDVRHRQLRVGLEYVPPPQNGLDVFDITQQSINEILSTTVQTAKWIGRTLGLPTKYVEEICKLAEVDPKSIGSDLTENDSKKIFDSVRIIRDKVVNGDHEPVIVKNEEQSDVYPIQLGGLSENHVRVSSFMEGLDRSFTDDIVEKGKTIQTTSSNKKIEELETKLSEQTKAISAVKEKSDTISNVAKSLSESVNQGILSINDPRIKDVLIKQNSIIIKEKGIEFLKIEEGKIRINTNSSIPSIASTLFNEAKKQFSAITSIEKLKKKTEDGLEKLKKKTETEKESITFSEVRKKNWYERYRWFFTSDGSLAIGGRDASSNSAVIRKHLEKNDKVFHAEIFGSPFFILKENKDENATSLNEVAHATVCFSRAWREAMYGLSAYWVNPEQVKKSAPTGQFLAKGSFSIEGKRNFVKVSMLKLAIGLLEQDENFLLVCGPLEPIKNQCVCYVIIEPTGSDMVNIAKKIKTEFIKLKGDIIKSLSVDDFVRVIPAGKSHISESGLGLA